MPAPGAVASAKKHDTRLQDRNGRDRERARILYCSPIPDAIWLFGNAAMIADVSTIMTPAAHLGDNQ